MGKEMIPAHDESAPGSPLIVRIGALGDMVLLTPLLDALVHRYGCACDLVGSRFSEPLFRADPRVGRILMLKSCNRPYYLAHDQIDLVRELRKNPPGPVFLLDTHPGIYSLLVRSGIPPHRVISRGKEGRQAGIHVVTDNLNLARRAETAPFDFPENRVLGTRLHVSGDARIALSGLLAELHLDGKPFVVIQIGTSRSLKQKKTSFKKHWPEDRWIFLIRNLLQAYPGIQVMLPGAPAETGLIDHLTRRCADKRVSNLAGMVDIPRLMALMERAVCSISVDTGPAHVAAAVACPLVVLFGGTYPDRNAPLSCGSPVLVVTGPETAAEYPTESDWLAHHSMLQISPESVMAAVTGIVGERLAA
ncbi:glycosyltransferase family 9 protein [bacterium]|nr:glycosyltransferase family 9 protein [candidate division CSSED10-310 bacterium]